MFLKLPNANTIETVTNCRFAAIDGTEFRRIIAMFPFCQENINLVIASFSNMKVNTMKCFWFP